MRIDGIQHGNPLERAEHHRRVASDKTVSSFKETLSTFLNDVNASQKASSDAQMKLISGEVNDVHRVMTKSEEAKVAFNMLMELRNKTIDGYQEIMRIRL